MSFGIGCSGGGGGLWVLANCYLLVLCFFIFVCLPMVVVGIGCGFAGWLTLDNGWWWLDVAKRAGWDRFGSGQLGLRVTGQNMSFLNGSIGLRVGSSRVDSYFSNNFFFFFNYKKTYIKLKRLRKKSNSH